MKSTKTFSQTTENSEVFFKYVLETIKQIEDGIKSTKRSEALRLIRKLKSQIETLESRLNSLPNNIDLFSNLDDIILSSHLNFQPELRAKIQRLRKELEELKKILQKLLLKHPASDSSKSFDLNSPKFPLYVIVFKIHGSLIFKL